MHLKVVQKVMTSGDGFGVGISNSGEIMQLEFVFN